MIKPTEPIPPQDTEELSPEQEREWDRLDEQGGSAGANAAMERAKVTGGRVVGGEAQLTLVGVDTDEAEASQHRRRNPLPSAKRQQRRGVKVGRRSQAWGEKQPSDDGQTPLNN